MSFTVLPINVYASNNIADGRPSFGYVIYIKHDDFERARAALGL